ncbi:MAG: succinate-semialdehyde dehydrogenase / glutarate-semialdehyde dehydrogenase, partial [Actinomycetota bacterium]|nr:succinate-semialdehyde dehydrogenase / glutarate-semialdehyde dehydrogenase [Actinomycetota bacterium]
MLLLTGNIPAMTVPDVAPRPLASPEPLLQDLVLRLAPGVTAGAHPETVTTVAPFTGGPLARLPLSTPDDVLAAYAGARAAQRPWAKRSVRERAAVFLRLHDLVLERQDELLDLIQLEAGKARRHALEEVVDVALNARHYGRSGPRYLRPTRHPGIVPVLSEVV